MTTDEAISAIPTGWRMYTVDMSIINRVSVMLSQTDHIGYVSAQAPTLAGAIVAASAKAKWHYRGWTIDAAYIGYIAYHDNYDGWTDDEGAWVDNGLKVYGMTVNDVKAQIDEKEDDR